MPSIAFCFRGAVGLTVFGSITLVGPTLHAASDPAALFLKKCSSCHSYGKGDRVGPDLKGVTDRRPRAWLLSWIQSSQRMLAGGDPTAKMLFEKYKHERMPDQNLAADDISALVDFLAAGGPASSDESRQPHAMTATAADITLGRDLFVGTVTPQSGGAPCASCHTIGRQGIAPAVGATLGGDLTHVYSKFQDAALSTFLQHPCFPRAFANEGAAPLTSREAFAVKAFLWQADRAGRRRAPGRDQHD
jgi:mono/diheme cytochrome c family protein